MSTNHTPFNRLSNFRDLGGIANKNGQKIKECRLLRSGELFDLPIDEQNLLIEDFELSMIVDLRGSKELDEKPNVELDGVEQKHIDIFKGNGADAPSEQNLATVHEANGADDHMLRLYEYMVHSEAAQNGYRDFLNILANNDDGAVLWHCFAGKDRTGMAAMLVLHLLDVDRDEIMKDYLRTVELRKKQNDEILAARKANGATEENIAYDRILLNVRDAYLERAYDVIEENFGTVDNYIFNQLGFPQEGKQKLQDLYLEAK